MTASGEGRDPAATPGSVVPTRADASERSSVADGPAGETDPRDGHAALRRAMREAGMAVGPDGPIARPGGTRLGGLIRRAFDVVVAGLALLVLAIPLGLVLLVVRLESPGSPIFRQRRVGLDGEEFDVLKVRTMVQGAERMGAGLAIVAGDARITRLGRLLRRTSIDELPQFVNVLRGEMSIVGPRPTVPVQIAGYDDRQRERLLVRPGLTGWAQIQGRTTLSWPERIELDRWYVAHRSLRTDLEILLRTVRVVLGGAGVQRDGAAWTVPAAEDAASGVDPAGPAGAPTAASATKGGAEAPTSTAAADAPSTAVQPPAGDPPA